jgi:hypothetical protein
LIRNPQRTVLVSPTTTREIKMTTHNPRTLTALALSAIGLVLTSCSSASTGAAAPSTHPDSSPITSSTVVVATSAAAPVVATSAAALPASSTAAPSSAASAVAATAAVACVLVTEAEISRALGADPGPGRRFASHGSSQCQYGTYQTTYALVNVTPTRGRAGYDRLHDDSNHHVASIDGVGDRAMEVSGPGTAGIYFNKGDALVVIVVVIHGAATPPESQALALAKLAASRI